MIQEILGKDFEENEEVKNNLTWKHLKKYAIVLWYENTEKIKEYIELIAKNEYKQNKL